MTIQTASQSQYGVPEGPAARPNGWDGRSRVRMACQMGQLHEEKEEENRFDSAIIMYFLHTIAEEDELEAFLQRSVLGQEEPAQSSLQG
ncbi:hypothetical protein NFI96_007164 [Prochilodus magdalenae]|nr:hypothetical protein NFI96_007164 [Prochilodus magdalenae]